MMDIQFEGIDKLMGKMEFYKRAITDGIIRNLQIIGDRVVRRLQERFPEPRVNIISQFSPNIMQYDIIVNGLIFCSVSGQRVLTSVEKFLKWKSRGRNETPLEGLDIQQFVTQIENELFNEISREIRELLK